MHLSLFRERDRLQGETLFKKGAVGQISFSDGTYQVEVSDPKEKKPFWPFLQMDEKGVVKDHFCSCAEAEEQGSCPHQVAAIFKIFNGQQTPLHVRFHASLWNGLCRMMAERVGFEPEVLKKEGPSGYKISSSAKKNLFSIKSTIAKGKNRLKEIVVDRTVETEETSIKFSNLSQEELTLWKQGRPSLSLQYELSFWSDLAKWWMRLQEEGTPYEIQFSEQVDDLPHRISVKFDEVEFNLYISLANWPEIIPCLATVKAPLKLFELTPHPIKKILYDPLKKAFVVDLGAIAKERAAPPVKTYPIGDWMFVPSQGFYSSELDPLLKEKTISFDQIGKLLLKHGPLIEKFLIGTKLHTSAIRAKYTLSFDKQSQLHLTMFVFTPGDLQQLNSAYFGPWVFVAGKGFYLLESPLFHGVEKVIPKDKISDFINRHRHWLNSQEGFEIHVSPLDSHLDFTLSSEKSLIFKTRLGLAQEELELLDLGEWIYIKGRGFYSKASGGPGKMLKPGITVPQHEISAFIRMHREELETITGFFSNSCPLEKSGLKLSLNQQEQIVISPEYVISDGYKNRRVEIFDGFTFVEKEGFCEIPSTHRLPPPYFKQVVIDASSEPYFTFYEIDTLQSFILSLDPRLQKPKELFLRIDNLQKSDQDKAGGWLISLTYQTDVGTSSAFSIWEAIASQRRYLFTPAGLLTLQGPRFNWLKGIPKTRWSKKGTQLRLTPLELIRLLMLEQILPPPGQDPESVDSRKLLEDLESLRSDLPLDLTGFQSKLRPYQEAGLKWLWFLYSQSLSGLLCDEMGLGKTHQAMGLLSAAHALKSDQKYLVVCPTSVIYHWEELLKRFLPNVRVAIFYGVQRTLSDFQTSFDLLLTSYGTLRSESKAIEQLSFDIAIFDELQIAKNSHSLTHKALKKVDAHMKLGLTGTPIENRLLELKALFDIVLPTYMPTDTLFKELFVHPIEKNQDAEKRMLLTRLIKPFILRRKKSEVLLELPEKIEEISYIDLSDEQKQLYRQVSIAKIPPLLEQLQDVSKPAPYTHVFALLTALKQVCDHPCLILKNTEDYKLHASGKWDLFVELLHETLDSGQKLVVFSQFLDMLDIIQAYLTEQKIGFAGIRGSTRDRKEQITRFRDDPSCSVFVGSLQAAGVGIDLIAASVVIHYDRWWNPAKENQATDRVHRIGQSRGVQVFKMVCKNTIEEHIHRLIERKSGLLEEVIGFDEQDHLKRFDRKELIELFNLIQTDIL